MSHEIRTPLNGVIGVSEVLSTTRLTAKQTEMVDLIRGSSETLERLLSDILDLSKIEAGKLHLETEPFDLEAEVDAAANLLRSRAKEKGLRFTITFEPGAAGTYLGDAVRLRQIVSNLVSNAVKFTSEGRVDVIVSHDSNGQSPHLNIVVEDTGPGFSPETLSRLFNRFEQADGSTTRLHGGTGLGLSIVKSLAEMQGGSVSVESQLGKGSRFEVHLPYPKHMGQGPVASAAKEEIGLQPRDGSLNILLAEDNPSNRKVVSIILEPYSVNLVLAEDGRQAVNSFREQDFDLILMDMQMPNMDGLTATRAIRDLELSEGRRRTPIAMLSANALSTHRQEAEDAGCDVFIAKPIRPEALLKGLEAALG